MRHIKNPGSCSLGKRRSSLQLSKPADTRQPVNGPRYSGMFSAFVDAKVSKGTGAAIINTCARVMRNDRSYLVRERGWNARLSHKMALALNMAEGCTNPWARVPYDAMVNG